MGKDKRHRPRANPKSNRIALSFEKAIESLLSTKPKKKAAKKR
jgi:hypothetical protein